MDDVFNKKGVTRELQVCLCWPSKYIWNQIFTYDGELDSDNEIPVEKRDYSCVLPSEFCNSTEWCLEFRESGPIGAKMNSDSTNWECFYILPSKIFGIESMIDGECVYTSYKENYYCPLNHKSESPTS